MAMAAMVSTYPDREAAMQVADQLVREKTVACVNIFDIMSVYAWKGNIEKGSECMAIFKTIYGKKDLLRRRISQTHPYDVPEIAEVDIASINKPYLDWLGESTAPEPPS